MGLLISSALIILGGFFNFTCNYYLRASFHLDLFQDALRVALFKTELFHHIYHSMYEFMLGLGGIGISALLYICNNDLRLYTKKLR